MKKKTDQRGDKKRQERIKLCVKIKVKEVLNFSVYPTCLI